MEAKEWRPWPGRFCRRCGGELTVFSVVDSREVDKGDEVCCTECANHGSVVIDDGGAARIRWDNIEWRR